MSSAQKVPFAKYLDRFTRRKIDDAIQLTGRALPCSVASVNGAIITVKFEVSSKFTLPQVSVPLFGPEYIRYPIQPGDLGIVFPADTHLNQISGLGSGVADLSEPGNLTALVFFPVANKSWSGVDPNSVTIYGPNGVVLRDTGLASVITLTPNGVVISGANSVSLSAAGASITLSGGDVNIVGVLYINGEPYLGHEHYGVTIGLGNTGGVVP